MLRAAYCLSKHHCNKTAVGSMPGKVCCFAFSFSILEMAKCSSFCGMMQQKGLWSLIFFIVLHLRQQTSVKMAMDSQNVDIHGYPAHGSRIWSGFSIHGYGSGRPVQTRPIAILKPQQDQYALSHFWALPTHRFSMPPNKSIFLTNNCRMLPWLPVGGGRHALLRLL